MRRSLVSLILTVCILGMAAAAAGVALGSEAGQRIEKLAQETVYADAAKHPMNATYFGLPGHDGDLAMPSRASPMEQHASRF